MSFISHPLGADTIPNFVTARTPQGLRRAMSRNNMKFKAFIVYRDIQFVNDKWIAWFDAPITQEEIESQMSGVNNG